MRLLAILALLFLPACQFFGGGETATSVPVDDAPKIGQWAEQDFRGFAGLLPPYDQVTDEELALYGAFHVQRIRTNYAVPPEPNLPTEEEKLEQARANALEMGEPLPEEFRTAK